MNNSSRFEAGPVEAWPQWEMALPFLPRPLAGKLMLGEHLGLSGMEVSLNSLPAGVAVPFAHRHREHEELYIFLSGRGELRVDDESHAVGAGTCVRIAPAGVRVWRNTGDAPLLFLVIQARAQAGVRGMSDGVPCPLPADWPTIRRSR